MSFWGATVITSLATAIPVVGKHIMYWLWGGFSVDNPTLNRFYSFHYTLPFVLAGLSIFHIAALHQYGSTNPLGVNSQSSLISFGSYFGAKDLVGALYLLLLFSILVFFYPDLLGHPDNLIPANPYSTPQHIVPEWYFLWVYAILRSIPNKAMGVLAIGLVFASLFLMPFIGLGGGKFRIITEWLYWTFLADVLLLTWLGGNEITPITSLVGQLCTGYLFLYLLVFQPLVGYLETQMSHGTLKQSTLVLPMSYGVRGFSSNARENHNLLNSLSVVFKRVVSKALTWQYQICTSDILISSLLILFVGGCLFGYALVSFFALWSLSTILCIQVELIVLLASSKYVVGLLSADLNLNESSLMMALWSSIRKVVGGIVVSVGAITASEIAIDVTYTEDDARAIERYAACLPKNDPDNGTRIHQYAMEVQHSRGIANQSRVSPGIVMHECLGIVRDFINQKTK